MSQDGILYKILDRFIGTELQMVDFLGQFMHLAKKNFEPGKVYNLHELCFVKRKPSDNSDGEVLQFFDEKLEIIEEIVLEDRASERLRVNEFLSFDGDGQGAPEIDISPKVNEFFNDILSLNDPGFVKKGGGRLSRILLEEDRKSERYTDRPDIPLFEDSEDGFQKVNPLSRAFEEEEDLTIKSSYNAEPDLFSDLGINPEKEIDEPATPDFLNSEEEEIVFTHSSVVVPEDEEEDDEETYSIFSGGIKVTPVTEEDESVKKEVVDDNEVTDFLESLVAVPEPQEEFVDEVENKELNDDSEEYSIDTEEIVVTEVELPEPDEEIEVAAEFSEPDEEILIAAELPEPEEEVEMPDELPEPEEEVELDAKLPESDDEVELAEEILETDELVEELAEPEDQKVEISEELEVEELSDVEKSEFSSEIQELEEKVEAVEDTQVEAIVESEEVLPKKQRISIFADLEDLTEVPEVETLDEVETEESSEEIVEVVDYETNPNVIEDVGLEVEESADSENDMDVEIRTEEELKPEIEPEDVQEDVILAEMESESQESVEILPEELDKSLEDEAPLIPGDIETIEIGADEEQMGDEEIDSLNDLIQGKEEIILDDIETIEIGDVKEQMGDEEIDTLNDLIQHKDENVYEVKEVVESESQEDKLMFDESFFDGVIENPEELLTSVPESDKLSESELLEIPEEMEPNIAEDKPDSEPELIDIPLDDEVTTSEESSPFKHLNANGEVNDQDSETVNEDLINVQTPLVDSTEYDSTNDYEESNKPPLIQDQDNGNTIKDESRVMEEETEPPKSQLSVLIKMLIVLAVIIATYFILQASGYLRGKNAVKTDENLAQGALVIVDSNLLADNREYPFNKDTQNDVNIKGAAFKDGRYFEVEENGTLNPVLYDTSTEKTYKVFVPFDSAAAKEDKKVKKDDKSKKEVDKKPVKKTDDNSNSGNITLQDAVKNKVKETKIADFIFKSGKKYYVQISAHRAFDTAEKLAKELKKKGYKSFVMKIKKSGVAGEEGVWYRVRVGPFDKEEKAREVNNTLNPKLKK